MFAVGGLFVLPIVACTVIDCRADSFGTVSISQILHREPLCTAFSYFGAILLLVLLNYQTQFPRVIRYIFALIGAKCLSIPLLLPLGSVHSDYYHDSFAVIGAFFEIAFGFCVCTDVMNCVKLPPGGFTIIVTTFIEAVSLLVGGILYYYGSSDVRLYLVTVLEYVFGVALVWQAKTIQKYGDI